MKDLYNAKCPRCKGDTFNKFNRNLAVVECTKCGFITNLKTILYGPSGSNPSRNNSSGNKKNKELPLSSARHEQNVHHKKRKNRPFKPKKTSERPYRKSNGKNES